VKIMFEIKLRQAATALVEFAIRIAPPHTRDWGRAMMGELPHVEGTWALTMWAIGSSSLLAKHALASLVIRDRHDPALGPDGGLFAKGASMGKSTVIATVGCTLAVLLMFAAPAFRQAFQFSLAPWHWVFEMGPPDEQAGLRELARRAEANQDAECLAYCAIWTDDGSENTRLADEAVRMDPKLVWTYALVALHHPRLPVISQWVGKLQQWQPHNALFSMIMAENRGFLNEKDSDLALGVFRDPVAKNAIAAAFRADQFDDYSDRYAALECNVASRYGLYNPTEVITNATRRASIPFVDSRNYAKYLVQEGKELEARGDKEGAMEKYWLVAHFGEMIDSQGHNLAEHINGTTIQRYAYQQLQETSERDGNHAEAVHFAYLVTVLEPQRIKAEGVAGLTHAHEFVRWNAWEVTASGLLMPVFACCLVAAALTLILWRAGTGPGNLRAKRLAAKLAVTGAVGMFLCSALLYVAFRPYAQDLNQLFDGNEPAHTAVILDRLHRSEKNDPEVKDLAQIIAINSRRAADLQFFLLYTQQTPFVSLSTTANHNTLDAVFDFWLGVVVLGLAVLVFVAIRHVIRTARPALPA
jgi:hypothetical protein